MKTLCKEVIERAVKDKGYQWFLTKVNIVGIRTNDLKANTYNDFLTLTWYQNNQWNFIGFEATTDPGLYWLKNPSNVKGCAIVAPGQYINLWQLGIHSGYEALVQTGNKIKVYRDNNRDNYLNLDGQIDFGYFGINCHRSHPSVLQWVIEKYSAGCQVIRKGESWNKFLSIIKANKQDFYSYTLLTEDDL
jgi:hypothetical protein